MGAYASSLDVLLLALAIRFVHCLHRLESRFGGLWLPTRVDSTPSWDAETETGVSHFITLLHISLYLLTVEALSCPNIAHAHILTVRHYLKLAHISTRSGARNEDAVAGPVERGRV
jgi:hypothetical protein